MSESREPSLIDMLIAELERVSGPGLGAAAMRFRLRELIAMLDRARRAALPADPRPRMQRAARTMCDRPWLIFPLRRGVEIALEGLPHDFTRRDLQRLYRFLETYLDEEPEAPAPILAVALPEQTETAALVEEREMPPVPGEVWRGKHGKDTVALGIEAGLHVGWLWLHEKWARTDRATTAQIVELWQRERAPAPTSEPSR